MRLLRLTTNKTTATFETTYNSTIILKPNSRIALQSASINTVADELSMSTVNNEISYQIIDGYNRTIQLTNRNYTRSQIKELLTDITELLNDSVTYYRNITTTNKPIGLEWKAHLFLQRVMIEYKSALFSSFFQFAGNWNFNGTNTNNLLNGDYSLQAVAGVPSTDSYLTNAGLGFHTCQGNGFIRSKIHVLEYNNQNQENGFVMALIENYDKIDSDNLTLADVTYGIKCDNTSINATPTYEPIVNGVRTGDFTNMAYTQGSADNEFMEITINGGTVDFNRYYQDGNGQAVDVLYTVPYANEKLYPVFIFFGENASAKVTSVRFTPSPFGLQPIKTNSVDDQYGLNAPPRPVPGTAVNENFLQMGGVVSEFLGYTNSRQPENGYITAADASYHAETAYFVPQEADAMLVQLMNLQIESYDSYSNTLYDAGGQRKNILSVIPSSSSTGKIIYEPNYPTFLDLYNNEPITLRNINVRVVREDYSDIEINGMATLVLLID